MAEHGARPGQARAAAPARRGDDRARPRRGHARAASSRRPGSSSAARTCARPGAEVLEVLARELPVVRAPARRARGAAGARRAREGGPRLVEGRRAPRHRREGLPRERRDRRRAGADARRGGPAPRRVRDAAEGQAEPRAAGGARAPSTAARAGSAARVPQPLLHPRDRRGARPVASSMSTMAPCSHTSRFAGSNDTGRAREEALEDELLPHADDRVPRPAHPDVGDEGGAAGEDARVGGLHVGVRARAPPRPCRRGTSPWRSSRSSPRSACRRGSPSRPRRGARSIALGRGAERVVEVLHEDAPLEVQHAELAAVGRRDDRAAAPRRARRVVRRAAGAARPGRSRYGTISRFAQMWFPLVSRSTSAARSSSADVGRDADAGRRRSPRSRRRGRAPRFAMRRGTSRCTAWRPGFPNTSPRKRTFKAGRYSPRRGRRQRDSRGRGACAPR